MRKHILAALLVLPVLSTAAMAPAWAAGANSSLGDLSEFKTIAQDTMVLVNKGDLTAAEKRITDFETNWDKNEPKLYPMNKTEWGVIDDAADAAIGSLRQSTPDAPKAEKAVSGLIQALDNPAAH